MKEYYKIDSDGFYAGTVLLPDDETPDPDLIGAPLPAGLRKYKYDSIAGAWTEGATAEEITAAATDDAKAQLAALDNPRDAETVFEALKAKGILADTDLAAPTLARFQQKQTLRAQFK